MNLLASLSDHLGNLVHPEARANSVEEARHRAFIGARLALSFGALALVPLWFAYGEAPAWWETGALAWLILPVAAVVSVIQTGRLSVGEAVDSAAWIGLTLTVAAGTGSPAALAFLLLVTVETADVDRAGRLSGLVNLLAAAAACAAFALTFGARRQGVLDSAVFAGFLVAAIAYGGVRAFLAGRVRALERRQHARCEHRYRVLADTVDDVLLRFDRSGAVLQASAAALRVLGVSPRDLVGRGLFERVHVADRPAFLKLVADAAVGIPGRNAKASLRFRTGRLLPGEAGAFEEPVFIWIDLCFRPFPAEDLDPEPSGAEPGLIALVRDVTAFKQQESALRAAQALAKRHSSGRDLFIANISHELRTPLNAIIGFAEMLASETLTPREAVKQREYAGIIQHSGHHLLQVVNGILDASKIESGSFDIVPEPFDLATLVKICCDMVRLRVEEGGIELEQDVQPGLAEVTGDKRACKQILLNLLSNAVKFTPRGGKVRSGARRDGAAVLIFVEDTGVGIAADDLPRLGDPFFQAHAQRDRPFDGTGLGLSVVRGLVGLHGGAMVIESAIGQGTRVSVRLPFDGRNHRAPTGNAKIETIARYRPLHPPVGAHDLATVHRVA